MIYSLNKSIIQNFDFVFLKGDIQKINSSTELFLSDIRGMRKTPGIKIVSETKAPILVHTALWNRSYQKILH